MSAGVYDLVIEAGSTFRRKLTWKDVTGAAVDLTGYTARLEIRDRPGVEPAWATLTSSNGGIVLGGLLGTIALYIPAATTSTFTKVQGQYDLELTAPGVGGDTTRLLEGKVVTKPEVTSG